MGSEGRLWLDIEPESFNEWISWVGKGERQRQKRETGPCHVKWFPLGTRTRAQYKLGREWMGKMGHTTGIFPSSSIGDGWLYQNYASLCLQFTFRFNHLCLATV